MRVGVIQSNYLPWRGYFDFISQVDLFVFHDDLQYTKGDWRNRNRIKTQEGLRWLTVPVHYRQVAQKIDETGLDRAKPWAHEHLNRLEGAYLRAPFFLRYRDELESLLRADYESISTLNISLVRWVMTQLGLSTPLCHSRQLGLVGAKTERLIDLLRKVGGTTYLSGPSAQSYLDLKAFQAAGIALEYKTYDYLPYPQLWGPFEGAVTVLDLLFNHGPASREYLFSRSPNVQIV